MSVRSTSSMSIPELSRHVERSQLLSQFPWLRHGVTQRVPGLGQADGNVGYTAPRDEVDAWEMRQLWARAIGVDSANLVRVRQVHGNAVRIATNLDTARGTNPAAAEAPIGDAIITGEPDVALMTLHADCLAMFVVDSHQRVVGAIHAGWRSTVQDIAGETIRAMTERFGCQPANIMAYVGPSIGRDRYQVGAEVIDRWQMLANADPGACCYVRDSWYFDLKVANASRLVNAGVPAQNIEISEICTASDSDHWFSHRGQGPGTGRFAAIISMVGEQS